MADPLSVAASLLTVLGAAQGTVRGLEQMLALRHAPKELLAVNNEISNLRATLRVIEISLRSLGAASSDSVTQGALRDIEALHKNAANTLAELDVLVSTKLQAQRISNTSSRPKVAIWNWVRQAKKLEQFRMQMHRTTNSLSAALTALNGMHLASLREQRLPLVSFAIQDVTQLPRSGRIEGPSNDDLPLQYQLERAVRHAVGQVHRTDGDQNHSGDAEANTTNGACHAPSSGEIIRSLTDIVHVTATAGAEICKHFCPCRCHVQTQIHSPRWMMSILGSMHFQLNSTILLKRRNCNYRPCKRGGRISVRLTYYTPSWADYRLFVISASSSNLTGINASIAVKNPGVLRDSDKIWGLTKRGDINGVRYSLQERAVSIYDVGEDGETLLHYAARAYQPDICALLMQLGADPFLCAPSGITAFELGLDHVFANPPGQQNLSRTIIERFKEVFANDDIYEELGFSEINKIVLGISGIELETALRTSLDDINTPDTGGRTPLMWAARRGDIQKLRVLLDWGADPTKHDRLQLFPLHKAVEDGNDECVRLLLAAGASATEACINGVQAIHNVRFSPYNRVESLAALIDHGADVNASDKDGCIPLHWLVGKYGPGVLDNVRFLIENGTDLDAVDNEGDSPAFQAMFCEDIRLIRFLIDHGARLDLKRNDGTTILHIAAWKNSVECWEMLMEFATSGRFGEVDTTAQHEGHNIWHCLRNCRSQRCSRQRRGEDEEKVAFRKLLCAVEEANLKRTGMESRTDMETSNTAETVLSEVEVTDSESIYLDAVEILRA